MNKRPHSNSSAGFTLIELMIVIAILAILLAIAVPAYQSYSIRAANTECINLLASVKTAVVETAQSSGEPIASMNQADIGVPATATATDRCSEFTLVSGVISVSSLQAAGASAGEFQLIPDQAGDDGLVSWTCTSDHTVRQHVPTECRN